MSQSSAQKISVAAHALLAHANPLAKSQLNSLANMLAARQPATALEIGCGPGSFSLQLAQLCAVAIDAVDINPGFLARAQENARESNLMGSVQFSAQDASQLNERACDTIICIGSSQAFGTPQQALQRCASMLNPKGALLFADLHWIAAPEPAFLEFLGVGSDFYWQQSAEKATFAALGLQCIEAIRTSPSSWQSYENAVLQGRLAYANSLSNEEASVVRERAQAWAQAFEKYGKHCFGFSAYLLEKL